MTSTPQKFDAASRRVTTFDDAAKSNVQYNRRRLGHNNDCSSRERDLRLESPNGESFLHNNQNSR